MQFYEKLTFLLNITQVSNRMLARELNVDPSLVSRLRTGARGLPRNREQIRTMADFFSKHCTTEYQQQALADLLQIKYSSTLKNEQLSEILFYWLGGDMESADNFVRTFDTFNVTSDSSPPTADSTRLGSENSVYYGNHGKRSAVRVFYQHLLSLKKPQTVFILADESQEWMSENPNFSHGLSDWAATLLYRNFRFCQILPPVTDINPAFATLHRWLPLYMTGQTAAYYYPYIRDNVHRRSLFIVPGEIAVASNAVASSPCHATILTTNPGLIKAFEAEFHDYLSLCRPLLTPHHSSEKLVHCFTKFLAVDGPRIQKLVTLSAESLPRELMEQYMRKIKFKNLEKLGKLYFQEMELLESRKNIQELIEIVPLATAAQVRNSRVPVMLSYGVPQSPLYYTPKTYAIHLENILRIMETCPNYHFVPIPFVEKTDSTLMVKEGHSALLLRTTFPLNIFEISQTDTVRLCREYLLEIARKTGYTGNYRTKIMNQLRTLIEELKTGISHELS